MVLVYTDRGRLQAKIDAKSARLEVRSFRGGGAPQPGRAAAAVVRVPAAPPAPRGYSIVTLRMRSISLVAPLREPRLSSSSSVSMPPTTSP